MKRSVCFLMALAGGLGAAFGQLAPGAVTEESLMGGAGAVVAAQSGGTAAETVSLVAGDAGTKQGNFAVTSRGQDYRVWSQATWETNKMGRVIAQTNSYTELTTGMHYRDAQTGEWRDSSPEFELERGWAVARRGAHRVALAADVRSTGGVDIWTSDNQHLRGHVLGLSYSDAKTGKAVLLGTTTNSIGQLLPSRNSILYTNAFAGIRADLVYVYTRAGFRQDVILRERPPEPELFGLNSEATRLQVLTEFVESPEPIKQVSAIRASGTNGATAGPELRDEQLRFGAMKMIRGSAFQVGDKGQESDTLPVVKSWSVLNERRFLVEEINWRALSPRLKVLPAAEVPGAGKTNENALAQRCVPRDQVFPPAPPDARAGGMLALAAAMPTAPGFVVDYDLLSSQTDFTFKGDTTYYVTDTVCLDGTTTIEGGSVVKFAANTTASIVMEGDVECATGPHRPAIFTGKDDNSVGAGIAGSTGNPVGNNYGGNGIYGGACLEIWGDGTQLKYVRFSHLRTALSYPLGNTYECRHFQMVRCQSGFELITGELQLRNGLVYQVGSVFSGIPWSILGEHVTFHNCAKLLDNCGAGDPAVVQLKNCLLVGVSDLGERYYGLDCQDETLLNSISVTPPAILASDTGVFGVVGAGAHYLAGSSPHRNAGNATIDAGLHAELREKTTCAPVVYGSSSIGQDATIARRNIRDDDGALDLGYHYDPLDYVIGSLSVQGCTLSLEQGVAIGVYSYGIALNGEANLHSVGTPRNPNVITRYYTTQELTPWPGTGVGGAGVVTIGDWCSADLEFTRISMAGQFSRVAIWGETPNGYLRLRNCEFYVAGVDIYAEDEVEGLWTASLHNNLFWRSFLSFSDTGAGEGGEGPYPSYLCLDMANNLLYGGVAWFSHGNPETPWGVTDNVFHKGTLYGYSGDTFSHNAYISATGAPDPAAAGDKVLTSFEYAQGPLGEFYHASDDLVDAGSRSAAEAGLFHFTVKPTNLKEGEESSGEGEPPEIVDMGYHYVAVNGNGEPADTDCDGTADYVEDANGNGVQDTENEDDPETCWFCVAIATPPTARTITYGETATFSVATMGDCPISRYQWRKNGTPIAGASRSSYSIAKPLVADSQAVFDVVVSAGCRQITSASARLTVNPRPLVATANSKIMGLNAPVPPLDGTIVGLQSSDTDIYATYQCSVVPSSAASYPITAVLHDPHGKLANYAWSCVPGTLTVDGDIPIAEGVVDGGAVVQEITTSKNTSKQVELRGRDPHTPPGTVVYHVPSTTARGGTLTLTGIGPVVTYTPLGDFEGEDAFEFTVSIEVSGVTLVSTPVTVAIHVTEHCQTKVFTSDADFALGVLANVNQAIEDELQLDPTGLAQMQPYLNVACSARGTLVRIDVDSSVLRGKAPIVGQYLTAPQGMGRHAARTTVDREGNVWVANSNERSLVNGVPMGSLTKIGVVRGGTRGTKYLGGDGKYHVTPDPRGEYVEEPDYCTAVDRDGDGLIRTSFGWENILPWNNAGHADREGGVSTAEDELILAYVRVPTTGVQTMAVDRNNNVWVGGTDSPQTHQLIRSDGTLIPEAKFNLGAGGRGGLVDAAGVLWSAAGGKGLLRLDPTKRDGWDISPWSHTIIGNKYGNTGLGVDPQTGEIWYGRYYGGLASKYSSQGEFLGRYYHSSQGEQAQGLVVDGNENVWVAHSLNGGKTVGRLRTDGTYVGNVELPVSWVWRSWNLWWSAWTNWEDKELWDWAWWDHWWKYANIQEVGGDDWLMLDYWYRWPYCVDLSELQERAYAGPTGVAVDKNNKIWVVNHADCTAMRIDPTIGTAGQVDGIVDLGGWWPYDADCWSDWLLNRPAGPEDEGDMTGFLLAATTRRSGTWTVTQDAGKVAAKWKWMSWNADTPSGTDMKVEVRAAETEAGIKTATFQEVAEADPVSDLTGLVGRYLEIRVTLSRDLDEEDSPSLHDLSVGWCEAPQLEPVILSPPQSQARCHGDPVSFRVIAAGKDLTYQWRHNGFPIYGANDFVFTISSIASSDLGDYSVEVANAYGSVVSDAAALSYGPTCGYPPDQPPSIVKEPEDTPACPGGNTNFAVTANGANMTFQWRFNSTPIAGATNPKLVLQNITPANLGNYSVVVANGYGSVASRQAALSFLLNPEVNVYQTDDAKQPRTRGRFTFTRSCDAGELTVDYTVANAPTPVAERGTDYQPLTGTVVFKDGEDAVTVDVLPIANPQMNEARNVTITLTDKDAYLRGPSSTATVVIKLDQRPTLSSIDELKLPANHGSYTVTLDDLLKNAWNVPVAPAERSSKLDPDGDALSFTVENVVSGSLMINGIPLGPNNQTIDAEHVAVWTAPMAADGLNKVAFTVRVTDGLYTAPDPEATPPADKPVDVRIAHKAKRYLYAWGLNLCGTLGDGFLAHWVGIDARWDILQGQTDDNLIPRDSRWGYYPLRSGPGGHVKPKRVLDLDEAVSLFCDGHVSSAVGADGCLYQWGILWNFLSGIPKANARLFEQNPALGLRGFWTWGAALPPAPQNSYWAVGSPVTLAVPTPRLYKQPFVGGSLGEFKDITTIAGSRSARLALSSDGRLWSWGSGNSEDDENPFGILGRDIKSADDMFPPKRLNGPPQTTQYDWLLCGMSPRQIKIIGNGIEGTDGSINYAQNDSRRKFVEVQGEEWPEAGIARCEDHSVWFWGSLLASCYGGTEPDQGSGPFTWEQYIPFRLGLPPVSSENPMWKPQRISALQADGDPEVTQVSLKENHVVVLRDDGTVAELGYIARLDDKAVPGHGTGYRETIDECLAACYRDIPYAVPGLENVQQVCAGNTYGLAVKDTGEVWIWGRFYDTDVMDPPPVDKLGLRRVPFPTKIAKVATDNLCVMAIDKRGCVWAWGMNDRGVGLFGFNDPEMGRAPYQNFHLEPVRIPELENVSDVYLSADGDGAFAMASPVQKKVTGVAATPRSEAVDLIWDAYPSASHYKVYRCCEPAALTPPNNDPENVANYTCIQNNILGNSYQDPPNPPTGALVNGHTYYYVVSAVVDGAETEKSWEVSATPLAPPGPPTITSCVGLCRAVKLEWSAPTTGGAVQSYKIMRLVDGVGYVTKASCRGNVTTYVDDTAVRGTTYYYKVIAINTAGDSLLDSTAASVSAWTTCAPPPVIFPDWNTPWTDGLKWFEQREEEVDPNDPSVGRATTATLRWQAPAGGWSELVGFRIRYRYTYHGQPYGQVNSLDIPINQAPFANGRYSYTWATSGLNCYASVSAIVRVSGVDQEGESSIEVGPATISSGSISWNATLRAVPGYQQVYLEWPDNEYLCEYDVLSTATRPGATPADNDQNAPWDLLGQVNMNVGDAAARYWDTGLKLQDSDPTGIGLKAAAFCPADVRDVATLVSKLAALEKDFVSGVVWAGLYPSEQSALSNATSDPSGVRLVLARALTRIINAGSCVFDPANAGLDGFDLSSKTRSSWENHTDGTPLTGEELATLNRLLLEDAYRAEIARFADPIPGEFVSGDIKDVSGLRYLLSSGFDPLETALQDRWTTAEKAEIPTATARRLAELLTQAIQHSAGVLIDDEFEDYQNGTYSTPPFTPRTEELFNRASLSADEKALLNRLLIEEAWPSVIHALGAAKFYRVEARECGSIAPYSTPWVQAQPSADTSKQLDSTLGFFAKATPYGGMVNVEWGFYRDFTGVGTDSELNLHCAPAMVGKVIKKRSGSPDVVGAAQGQSLDPDYTVDPVTGTVTILAHFAVLSTDTVTVQFAPADATANWQFCLERSAGLNNFERITETGFGLAYLDEEVVNDQSYTYRVTAFDQNYNRLQAITSAVIPGEANSLVLTATPGNSFVDLEWSALRASSYELKCGPSASGPWTTLATLNNGNAYGNPAHTYQHVGAQNGVTHYYYVIATPPTGGTKIPSAVASATPLATLRPLPPGNFKAEQIAGGDAGRIHLTWTARNGVAYYQVFVRDQTRLVPLNPVTAGTWLNSISFQTPISVGTFTVKSGTADAVPVTLAATDTLKRALEKINEAEDDLTATYDPTTGKVTIKSTAGAAIALTDGTCNFKAAMHLDDGTGNITSTSAIWVNCAAGTSCAYDVPVGTMAGTVLTFAIRSVSTPDGATLISDPAETTVTYDAPAEILDSVVALKVAGILPTETMEITGPTNLTLAVDASLPNINKVTYYADGNVLKVVNTSPYETTWFHVPGGPHNLKATVEVRKGFTSVNAETLNYDTPTVTMNVTVKPELAAYQASVTDLQLPAPGLPITLARAYNSRDKETADAWALGWKASWQMASVELSADLGTGWKGLYGEFLNAIPRYYIGESAAHYVTVTLPDGRSVYFAPQVSYDPSITPGQYNDWDGEKIGIRFGAYEPSQGSLMATADGLAVTGWDSNGKVDLQMVEQEEWNDVALKFGEDLNYSVVPPSFTYRSPGGTLYQFVRIGTSLKYQMEKVVDLKGNSLSYKYRTDGKLEEIKHSYGRTVTFEYEAVTSGDYAGCIVTKVFDSVTRDTSAPGPVLVYVIDDTTKKLKEVRRRVDANDPSDGAAYETTTYQYGNTPPDPDPMGSSYTIEERQDANANRLTDIYDARGIRVLHNQYRPNDGDYISNGDLWYQVGPNPAVTTEFVLEPDGSLTVSQEDGDDTKTMQVKHDESGAISGVTLAGEDTPGPVTGTMTYNDKGQVVKQINADGSTKTFEYDDQGRLIGQTDENNNSTSVKLDDNGLPLEVTDARGKVTTSNTYDTKGNPLSSSDELAGTDTTYEYYEVSEFPSDAQLFDALKRERRRADGIGYDTVTEYTYKKKGSSDKVRGEVETVSQFWVLDETKVGEVVIKTIYGYDDNGNRTAEIKQRTVNGNTEYVCTKSFYDAQNRVLSTEIHARRNTKEVKYDRGASESVNAWVARVFSGSPLQTTQVTYNALGKQKDSTDAYGRKTQFVYDLSGNLIATIYPDLTVSRTAYTSEGKPEYVQDRAVPNGNHTTAPATKTEYDASGRAVKVLRYASVVLTLNIAQPRDLDHAEPGEYDYVGADDAEEQYLMTAELPETPVVLTTTRTEYDDRGRVLYSMDTRGNVTEYIYDAGGRRTGVKLYKTYRVDPLETGEIAPSGDYNETTYGYDQNGNQVWVKDALEHQTDYKYDDANRQVRVTFPETSDSVRHYRTTIYDGLGQRVAETDEAGVKTTYQYDFRGLLTAVTLAVGTPQEATTTYAYDEFGNQTSQTDAQGRVTTFAYDALGRRTQRLLPGAASTAEFVAGAPNPNLETVTYGLMTHGTEPTTRYEVRRDFKGQVLASEFDQSDRLIRKTPGLLLTGGGQGVAARAAINPAGANNALQFESNTPGPGDNGVTIWFSDQGYDLDAGEAAATYDTKTRILTIALTSATTAQTVLTAVNGAAGSPVTATLDAVADPSNDGSGTITLADQASYTYTALGQRSIVTQSGATSRTVKYGYDNQGRLRVKWSPEGTLSYTYDDRGPIARISARSHYTWPALNANALAYIWDDASPWSAATHADGAEWNYAYDNLSRLEKVNDDGTHADATYTYNEVGALKTTEYRNGVATAYTYNDRNWLRMLETKKSGALVARFDYDNAATGGDTWAADKLLSPTGQRKRMAEWVTGTSRTVDYDYDALKRLTRETLKATAGSDPFISYDGNTPTTGYDLVGNRRSRQVSGTWSGVTSYTGHTFDERDLLNPGNAFAYDANGNTTAETANGDTYHYDTENRLIKRAGGNDSQNQPLPTIELTYDADGNRVSKTVNGTTTKYLVEDRNPTGYAQVMEERDGTGATVVKYVCGLDLISQTRNTGTPQSPVWATHYYGYDGLGSVRYLTDGTTGAVTDTYTYDAFGILIERKARRTTDGVLMPFADPALETPPALTSPVDNAYRYTGEQWDQRLGMYYLRARFYKPELGRFWTMDSYEGSQSDPLSLHKYLYAHANPVNGIDPSGQETLMSIQFTWNVISFVAGEDARLASSALKAARGMFGGTPDVDSLIFAMDVGETLADAAAIGGAAYGVFKLSKWLVTRGVRWFSSASRVMQTLEKDAATGRFLFVNLVKNETISAARLTPAYQIVRTRASGYYTYVVMPNGELRLGLVGIPGFPNKHVDLANGQRVWAAGEAVIENGVVKLVTDASGHYNGAGLNAAQKLSQRDAALEAFSANGLRVEKYTNVF